MNRMLRRGLPVNNFGAGCMSGEMGRLGKFRDPRDRSQQCSNVQYSLSLCTDFIEQRRGKAAGKA